MSYIGAAQDSMTNLSVQTANRAFGTAYQNTNMKPMGVFVTGTANAAGTTWTAQLGSSSSNMANIGAQQAPASNIAAVQFIVPPGAWYQVNSNNTSTLSYWTELF